MNPKPLISRILLVSAVLSLVTGVSAHASEKIEIPLQNEPKEQWVGENGFEFYGPRSCTAKAQVIGEAMFDYRVKAYQNKNPGKKFPERALKELKSVSEDHPCFLWLHNFYVLAAIHSYGHEGGDLYLSLSNIAAEMAKELRFRPFTDRVRNDWGGVWKESPEKILGAYDCRGTLIYFDRDLRPFNLAAVLSHELDHLIRDKFSYFDHADVFVRDVSRTLFLDEVLATSYAGFTQLSFFRDNNRDAADRDTPKRKGFQFDENSLVGFSVLKRTIRPSYSLGSDLNLYDKRGNLYRLWKRLIAEGGFPIGSLFSVFLDRAVLSELPSRNGKGRLDEFSGILDLVGRAYFDGRGPSTRSALEELDFWAKSAPDYVSPLSALQIKAVQPNAETTESGVPLFYKTLADRIGTVSTGCKMISSAIASGKVDEYIGSRLSMQPHGGEGSRPEKGGEGSRPTTQGGEGSRPGKGGEGSRPSAPLTPCLRPNEKI